MGFLSLSHPTRRRYMAAGDSAFLPAQGPDPPSSSWLRSLPAVTSRLSQMAVTVPSCPARARRTPRLLTRRSSHHTLATGWVMGMSGSSALPFQMTRTLDWQDRAVHRWHAVRGLLNSDGTLLIDRSLMQCSIYSADGERKTTAVKKRKKKATDWQQTPVLAALFLSGFGPPSSGHVILDETAEVWSVRPDCNVRFWMKGRCRWMYVTGEGAVRLKPCRFRMSSEDKQLPWLFFFFFFYSILSFKAFLNSSVGPHRYYPNSDFNRTAGI